MIILKRLAGVLTFIMAFGLSTAATRYLYVPFHTAEGVSSVAPAFQPGSTREGLLAPDITHEVKLISLDFETRQSYTTLTLSRDNQSPAPEKLWVRTYFIGPAGTQPYWSSETVEIDQPFQSANTVTLTATSPCHWCGQSSAPREGYYARVFISTRSADDVMMSSSQGADDLRTLIPVLVQRGR